MPFLDVRTVIFSHVVTDTLCVAMLTFLWLQNRKRFRGTSFWLLDIVCQTLAVVLIVLRGAIPDWLSMTFINTLTVTGAFLGFVGLTYFVGRRGSQVHNYVLLAIFLIVHLYYLFVNPSLIVRNINISIGLLIMCFQCVWLVFHRIEPGMRRSLRGVGLVFVAFCAVSFVRIFVILINPYPDNNFFHAGTYDTLLLLSYQILLILLTFAFTLSVNQRLVKDVRTQEEKFSKAFRSSPYGITLTSPSDGRILDVNDGFMAISGYSSAEVIGKSTLDLHLWLRDEDRITVVSELTQGKRVVGREFQFRKKSGEVLTGLFSAEIIEVDDQPWILSSIADISERKQAEEALLKGNTVLKNMLLASSGFIDSSSSGIDYQKMTDALLEIAGAKYAAFNAFDSNGLDFTTMAVSGLLANLAKASSLLGFQLVNKKWKHDPIRAEKTKDQAVTLFVSLHDLTGTAIPAAISILIERTFDIGEVAIVKTVRNTRAVGDFTLFFSRGHTLQNRELVELFANESGLFMERTQAEEALRASEQRYRLLFTSMVSGFALLEMIYDGEGLPIDYRHIEVNPAHETLTGLKTESVIGRTIKEVVPDIEDFWVETYGRVDKTGVPEHLEQYSQALSRWFSVYVYRTAPGMVAVTFENITERKQAEEALGISISRQEALLAAIPDIIMEVDNHKVHIWTNQAGYEFYGADVIGKEASFYFEGEQETYSAVIPLFNGDEQVLYVESWQRRQDGEKRLLAWWCRVLKDAQGVVTGALSTGRDITEHKQAEVALRESEDKYRLLVDNAGESILVIQDGLIKYVNPAMLGLLGGYSEQELLNRPLADVIYPDDRNLVVGNYQRRIAHETLPARYAFRVLARDGGFRWVYINVALIEWQGKPATLSFLTDISETKQVENALRESEGKYRELVEHLSEGVAVANPEDVFTFANPAAEFIFGVGPGQLVGNKFSAFLSPENQELVRQKTLQRAQGRSDAYELEIIHAGGEHHFVRVTASPLYDANHRYNGSTGIFRDITASKRAEEALRETSGYLNNLLDYANAPIIVWDAAFRITLFNHAFERLTGRSASTVLGEKVDLLFPPDKREEYLSNIRQASSGERWEVVEIRVQHVNGDIRTLLWNSASLYASDEKTVVATIAQGQDITERKQAEDEIRSLARFVSENPDAVLRVAQNGILLYVNPQGLVQLPEWHLRVGNLVPLIVQSVVNESMGSISRLALDLEHNQQIFSFLVVPVVDAGYANLYGHDVTHRRQSEKALADSEERFQLANQATFNVIWDWNLTTETLWFNENYQKLSGYSADELQTNAEWWTNQIHPQDLERVMTDIQTATASGLDRWLEECRVQRKDGSYADVEVRGHIARDSRGNPVRMIGAMRDISQHKRSANYLEMSGQVLQILNESEERQDWVQRVLELIKTRTGFSAVGIRLQEGEDYPYLAELGFDPDFMLKENSLLERTADGEVSRNQYGDASLECTCGMVITGKTEASSPFFTPGGSFWTNDALPLLDMPPEQDPRHNPRNHCIFTGFSSIALIPIRDHEKTVGLLHLCDQRKGCFADDTVELLEGIASHIGAALLRKKAEDALMKSDEQVRLLLNSAEEGIYGIDLRGNCTFANPACIRLLGYADQAALLGKNMHNLVHHSYPDGRPMPVEVCKIVKAFREGNGVHVEDEVFWKADGASFPTEYWSNPQKMDGELYGAVVTFLDITERRRAEQALRESKERENQTILNEQQLRLDLEQQAAQALREKSDELVRSNQELQQFAYVASHDLQEPLRMVASYTQLLSEKYKGQLDEKADKYIGYAVDGALRMQRLISDLLSYSRVSTQAKPFVETSCADLMSEAIHDLGKAIEDSGAQVTVDELPTVLADRTQLKQVFQNLIANAIKFRGDDPPRVEVTVHRDGANWEFCVADNGIGIDPKNYERIFIIFQRLHEQSKYPGSGIGLSIVKKIVERHGGRIWIESEVGKGSQFKFTMPAIEPADGNNA